MVIKAISPKDPQRFFNLINKIEDKTNNNNNSNNNNNNENYLDTFLLSL